MSSENPSWPICLQTPSDPNPTNRAKREGEAKIPPRREQRAPHTARLSPTRDYNGLENTGAADFGQRVVAKVGGVSK